MDILVSTVYHNINADENIFLEVKKEEGGRKKACIIMIVTNSEKSAFEHFILTLNLLETKAMYLQN